MAINVSPVDFEQALEGPITLVDFWADWCGPCKLMAPVLDELEAHYQDRVKFVRYVLFRDGVAKEKVTGIYNYQQLSHYLDRKLAE